MNTTKRTKPTLNKVPIYEVKLVRARRSLRIAEECVADSPTSARALHSLIGSTDREHFACLFVNGRMHVTGAHIAFIGGQHSIGAIEPRVILRAALAACASAIVLGHNHPSGDPRPSDDDIEATMAIAQAAKVIGMSVIDHVIVTRDPLRYHSMYEKGTLAPVAES